MASSKENSLSLLKRRNSNAKNTTSGDSVAKRLRSSGRGQSQEVQSEQVDEGEGAGIGADDSGGSAYTGGDEDDEALQQAASTSVAAHADTRIKSRFRAIHDGTPRPVMCARCAGEVARFPDLVCATDPASSAAKCFDCKKKNKACELVSSKCPIRRASG